jgi:hypothetical protein
VVIALAAAALTMPLDALARSIPPGRGQATAEQFIGRPAIAKPVALQTIPQNPFMAAGSTSNIHNDSYMTDTYRQSGPLGDEMSVTSVMARASARASPSPARARSSRSACCPVGPRTSR